MYDVTIIGTGMAGLSAALTLQLHNKSILWLGTKTLSGKIRKAEKIKNYPLLSDLSGEAFCKLLQEQVEKSNLLITEERVQGVYALKDKFSIATDKNVYESKTVIVATGVESVKSVQGEEEFLGRGVSYCATCDGFLYKDKTIAVIATEKEKEGEVEYLASLAKEVYYFPIYKNPQILAENVIKMGGMPKSIEGERRVERIQTKDRAIPVDGVFILKSAVAPSVLVGGLKAENGHIVVARDMSTNLKGLFAAGDCTGEPYQYTKAAGEGNVAAHSVIKYLDKAE